MRHLRSILSHISSIGTISFVSYVLLATATPLSAQQTTFVQRQDGVSGELRSP